MNTLQRCLADIVEPTFEDFKRNPRSVRHAFLACVAAYHSIDRASHPKIPGNLRKKWRSESLEFLIVDMVAHKFKHVISDVEKQRVSVGRIPLSAIVFGSRTLNSAPFNTRPFNQGGIDLHNLFFVIRDAIAFLREQAEKLNGP